MLWVAGHPAGGSDQLGWHTLEGVVGTLWSPRVRYWPGWPTRRVGGDRFGFGVVVLLLMRCVVGYRSAS